MGTIVKTSEADKVLLARSVRYGSTDDRYKTMHTKDVIIYDDGPKYVDGHCTIKNCEHLRSFSATVKPVFHTHGTYKWWQPAGTSKIWSWDCFIPNHYFTPPKVVPPAPPELLASLREGIQKKIDLNCHDRVMAYSYVLDLIPMIGALTRASSTLNKVGKWVGKTRRSLKRKPFTTVLREAAKADLLNRFVVQTTIQDTKAILDAYDRCVRTIATASHRNEVPTVLTASATAGEYGSTSRTTFVEGNGDPRWSFTCDVCQAITHRATAHVVADVRYNTRDADPVKWYMHALGIDTPLESIWDKIPFSFVVDYFFRIGDFINYIGDHKGQKALMGNVVRVYESYITQTSCAGEHYSNLHGWNVRTSDMENNEAKFNEGTIGVIQFSRTNNVGVLTKLGFWDKGGLWNPHLSSVRKRTLLELGLLLA